MEYQKKLTPILVSKNLESFYTVSGFMQEPEVNSEFQEDAYEEFKSLDDLVATQVEGGEKIDESAIESLRKQYGGI